MFKSSQISGKLGTVGAVLAAKWVKFSWLVGSQISWLSAINIVAPLAGIVGGVSGALLAGGTKLGWAILTGASLGSATTSYLPHLLASYYWRTNFKLFRVLYPLVCLTVFVLGTNLLYGAGSLAGLYSALWLIPVLIGVSNTTNQFYLALGSTFCAHATGSCIWLALVPMTELQWVMLIPVALIERLLFATGIYVGYQLLCKIPARLSQTQPTLSVPVLAPKN